MEDVSNPIASSSALTQISYRLSQGDDPQDLLVQLVDAYLSSDGARHVVVVACIDLLSKNGALVATAEPDCALEKIIRLAGRPNSDMVENIAHRLVDRPGELPFHVIAKHFPILLSYNQLIDPDIQASLRARDKLGRTICHYLWDPQSVIVSRHQAVEAAADLIAKDSMVKDWFSCVRRSWTAQDKLQSVGIGMDIPDHEGVTALDLCVERLEADDIQLLMSFDSCKQVQATMSRRSMATETPMGKEPLPGPRF